ncbi:uncharacterized protein LOC121706212 [Alosa sapidissima]|uniref:uncharacterized protein LOC121706212 n=1 Tax=Alosa sapidissima TaxID=34773 RepID=UPI001C0A1CA1|nr:uncharacterized protein LOC121706212 [Alosa sapidissima]
MASALVVLVLASAIVFSACISPSQGFDMDKWYLEEKVPGEPFSLHCSTQEQQSKLTLYKLSKANNINIMHVFREESDKEGTPTYHQRYMNRVNFTGPLKDLSIIITNLTEEDSGVYYCKYTTLVKGDPIEIMANKVFVLFVNGPVCLEPFAFNANTGPMPNTNFILILFSTITAVGVLLMFLMMLVFYVIPKIKTLRAPQAAQNRGNDVYEVMSATLKRT